MTKRIDETVGNIRNGYAALKTNPKSGKSSLIGSDGLSASTGMTSDVSLFEVTLHRARKLGLNHANPAYLDHNFHPVCCDHHHMPGRGGHNVPVDGSQCCYHRCRTYPHYKSTKPG